MWPFTTDIDDTPAEVRTTHQSIASLNNDVKASSVNETFKTSWYDFVKEWLQWVDSIKRLSVYTAPLYAKSTEYRKRVLGYFDAFKRAGGKPTVTPPPPPPPPKGLGDYVITGVAILAGVLGVAYVVGQKVKG